VLKDEVLTWINNNPPVVVVILMAWRADFIRQLHECRTSGHLGREKTFAKAKENGHWTNMNSGDIKEFVKNCH